MDRDESGRPSAHPSDSARDVAGEEFLFHLYRGSELLQDSRVHEAKEELEHALLLQPRDPKGQDLLAVVYFRIGLYPRAIQIYEQLKRDNPESHSLRLNLALCYLKTGQAMLAREELENVIRTNPEHKRAWGYLGLAYERLADFDKAASSFERGGHFSMAKRMQDKAAGVAPSLGASGPPSVSVPSQLVPSHAAAENEESEAVRAAAAEAFQELDAGELSFALAEPAVRRSESGTWRAVELGEGVKRPGPRISYSDPAPAIEPAVVTAFPPSAAAESARLRSIADESVTAIMDVPPVAAQPAPAPAPAVGTTPSTRPGGLRTLSAISRVAAGARLAVDSPSGMGIDATGLLLLQLEADAPGPRREFAARLDGLRGFAGALATSVLERRGRGVPAGEAFGGLGVTLHRLAGDALVALAPRPARHVVAFVVDAGEPCFVREDIVLAFDLALAYENGKVARESDEPLAVVQLRGVGAVAIELLDPLRALPVAQGRSVVVREKALLGWTGRVVPRELPGGEAPAAQRGLVELTGEGTALVAGLGGRGV